MNYKTSFPKRLNVRNLELLDITDNKVGDLLGIINSTIGGLIDVIIRDDQINQSIESKNKDLKDNPIIQLLLIILKIIKMKIIIIISLKLSLILLEILLKGKV